MKHLFKHTCLILCLSSFLSQVSANDCNFYIPLVENSGMEFQNFNHRNRLQGSQKVTVKKVEQTGSQVIATMNNSIFDDRNREIHQSDYQIKCDGNHMMIDIKSLIDPNMLAGFKNMEIQMETDDILIPNRLSVGQTLPDSRMMMKVKTGNVTFADITLEMVNRTVTSKESITVPAGTFDCFKITYELLTVTSTMGIPLRVNARVVEYHSPNKGPVRSETYDSRDRLQGYTVLSNVF
jgi:hypothetical protein